MVRTEVVITQTGFCGNIERVTDRMVKFSLASGGTKDAAKADKYPALWHSYLAFDGVADFAEANIKTGKGSDMVRVTGKERGHRYNGKVYHEVAASLIEVLHNGKVKAVFEAEPKVATANAGGRTGGNGKQPVSSR